MSSSLKARFARQDAVRVIDRVSCGSPVAVSLTVLDSVKPVSAALALAKRHLPMLRAKRTVEAMLADGKAFVEVPMVEDIGALAADLREAGVAVHVRLAVPLDVRDIRARTGFTQEQFALRYQIDLATLRNWEQGRFQPDPAARNYLGLIAIHPKEVEAMIWEG
jgi:putative transcriptional regulator